MQIICLELGGIFEDRCRTLEVMNTLQQASEKAQMAPLIFASTEQEGLIMV